MIWTNNIYPLIQKKLRKIDNEKGRKIAIILCAFLIINMIVSTIAVLRWQLRLVGQTSVSQIGELIDKLFPNEFMNIIYPTMMSL